MGNNIKIHLKKKKKIIVIKTAKLFKFILNFSVIEMKTEDRSKFFDALISLLQ